MQGSADVIANLVTVFVTSLEGIEEFDPSHDGGAKIHSQVEKRQNGEDRQGVKMMDEMKEEDRAIVAWVLFRRPYASRRLGEEMGISKSWMGREKHAQAISRLRQIVGGTVRLK